MSNNIIQVQNNTRYMSVRSVILRIYSRVCKVTTFRKSPSSWGTGLKLSASKTAFSMWFGLYSNPPRLRDWTPADGSKILCSSSTKSLVDDEALLLQLELPWLLSPVASFDKICSKRWSMRRRGLGPDSCVSPGKDPVELVLCVKDLWRWMGTSKSTLTFQGKTMKQKPWSGLMGSECGKKRNYTMTVTVDYGSERTNQLDVKWRIGVNSLSLFMWFGPSTMTDGKHNVPCHANLNSQPA